MCMWCTFLTEHEISNNHILSSTQSSLSATPWTPAFEPVSYVLAASEDSAPSNSYLEILSETSTVHPLSRYTF